jgi:hypothetical protein
MGIWLPTAVHQDTQGTIRRSSPKSQAATSPRVRSGRLTAHRLILPNAALILMAAGGIPHIRHDTCINPYFMLTTTQLSQIQMKIYLILGSNKAENFD